jgi:Flp pilus assembly protein TadD
MKQRHAGAALAAILIGCALLLGGCSSLSGAFGEKKAALADVPNIEFYASDEAVAQAKNHFRERNYGYSAAFYKRAVELLPSDVEALFGLAASYDRLHRFDLADRIYAQLFKLKGGTVQYYNNVGYSYMLRGNLSAARTSFLKAQNLDPDSAVVANNLQLLGSSARLAER